MTESPTPNQGDLGSDGAPQVEQTLVRNVRRAPWQAMASGAWLVVSIAALSTTTGFFLPAFGALWHSRDGGLVELPKGEVKLGDLVEMVVFADSEPAGAEMSIQNIKRGVTPAILNVECHQGERLEVAVSKRGYRRHVRSVLCEAGGTARVRVAMRESAKSGKKRGR